MQYTHEQLIDISRFNPEDITQIRKCRQEQNRLGFGYQLAFVRLLNRFPTQTPFEVINDILAYVSIQLNIPSERLDTYNQRQPTVSNHQETIRKYLGLIRFAEADPDQLNKFLFGEACRTETTRAILAKTKQFLSEQSILQPSDDTLQRLIARQREQAKDHIYARVASLLTDNSIEKLKSLISTADSKPKPSAFQMLKQPAGRPSPGAMLKLIERLETIQSFGIMDMDLAWLNNNFQRALTRYAKQCTATRLRRLERNRRHAVMICFLWQSYLDTIDSVVDMYDKLINKIYKRAQADVDDHHKKNRKQVRESLSTFKDLVELILDEAVDDGRLREELFRRIDKDVLTNQIEAVNVWLTGKYSHVFNLVTQRFSYIRQFSPALVHHLHLIAEGNGKSDLPVAIDLLKNLNQQKKRKLPDDAPLAFIPKKLRPLVKTNGIVDKAGWECALLTAVRDEIRAGNISVKMSKRFGRFDAFFISDSQWAETRERFFSRAGLPINPA